MRAVKHEGSIAWPLDILEAEDRIDRAFRGLAHDYLAGDALPALPVEGRVKHLRVEEYLEGDTCVIRAELPGIDPEKDVEITVGDSMLTITAHREERSEQDRPEGFRSEFHYGGFERRIRLPEGATDRDVTATYADGILEVRVPAPTAVTPRVARIAVSRG